jgi:hypothetical protein
VIAAVDSFAFQWHLSFKEDIRPLLNDIKITFYKKTEKQWNDKCVRGSTDQYNFGSIRVAYLEDGTFPIYKTAMWHELVHLTLGKQWKTGDYNHSAPPGPWLVEHDELIATLKRQAKAEATSLSIQEYSEYGWDFEREQCMM